MRYYYLRLLSHSKGNIMEVSNYEQKLKDYQALFLDIPKFNYLLGQLEQVINTYQKHQLPNFILSDLRVNTTDFTQLMADKQFLSQYNLAAKSDFLQQFARFLDDFRDFIQTKFGIWAMLNQPMMDCWVQLFPHVKYLELMAGNGILASALQERGQQVIATDNLTWAQSSATGQQKWTTIEQLDALEALQQYFNEVDVVLLAWSPDHDNIDVQILQFIRKLNSNLQFWIIGEYQGATNSAEFWQQAHLIYDWRLAKINRLYPAFDIVKDHVFKIG